MNLCNKISAIWDQIEGKSQTFSRYVLVSFLALSLVVVLASVVESENRLMKLIEDIFLPDVSFLP